MAQENLQGYYDLIHDTAVRNGVGLEAAVALLTEANDVDSGTLRAAAESIRSGEHVFEPMYVKGFQAKMEESLLSAEQLLNEAIAENRERGSVDQVFSIEAAYYVVKAQQKGDQ